MTARLPEDIQRRSPSAIEFLENSKSWRGTTTIGFDRWLRIAAATLLAPSVPRRRPPTPLAQVALSERDLADLNLPDHVAATLRARQAAADLRRRLFR